MKFNNEDVVWLEAKAAMAALGIKNSSTLSRMCKEGKVQRRANEYPQHPRSVYRYAVPRRLREAVNPSLPVREDSLALAQPQPACLSEDQIQRIAKAFATSMEFVIADELRKAMQGTTRALNEPKAEEPERDPRKMLEEQAETMARRIGFSGVNEALENLQSVSVSKANKRLVVVAVSAFQRRIDQFNEENESSFTLQDVAKDLHLYLAVCAQRAPRQREIRALQSVRDSLRNIYSHLDMQPTPAA